MFSFKLTFFRQFGHLFFRSRYTFKRRYFFKTFPSITIFTTYPLNTSASIVLFSPLPGQTRDIFKNPSVLSKSVRRPSVRGLTPSKPHGGVLVPSGAPRGVEGEALNATAVRVKWRAPAPELQHGQIRGYQVHYGRLEHGEPRGQPSVKDILMEDSQVRRPLATLSLAHVHQDQWFSHYYLTDVSPL